MWQNIGSAIQLVSDHWLTIMTILTFVATAGQLIQSRSYSKLLGEAKKLVLAFANLELNTKEKRTHVYNALVLRFPLLTAVMPKDKLFAIIEEAWVIHVQPNLKGNTPTPVPLDVPAPVAVPSVDVTKGTRIEKVAENVLGEIKSPYVQGGN